MLISVNGPDISEFDVVCAVDNWILSGKRRLEGGHSTQTKKAKKCN